MIPLEIYFDNCRNISSKFRKRFDRIHGSPRDMYACVILVSSAVTEDHIPHLSWKHQKFKYYNQCLSWVVYLDPYIFLFCFVLFYRTTLLAVLLRPFGLLAPKSF